MAENLQDSYIAEVANSDNNSQVNSSEKIALVFLKEQKGKLPDEQFQRLLKETMNILTVRKIEEWNIRKECEKALADLTKNIEDTKKVQETEQFLVQELGLKDVKGISLDLIEWKIKNLNLKKIEEISKFLSVKFDGSFCPHLFGNFSINILSLHSILNETQIEKQKDLLNTKMLAFIESKWKTKEEAQKMVDEIHQWPEWIHACNTSMLKHILHVLEKHGIKNINFNDKDSLADIIQTKIDIEQKTNEWKLQSLGINSEDLKDIQTEDDALKLAAVNKLDPEETQQLLQALERKKQIKKQQENAEILWNADKKEFNYLVTTLQNGGDPKTAMQGVKSMQEERLIQEKQDSSESTKSHHRRSIDSLKIGQEISYNLSRSDDSEKQDRVHIKKVGDNDYRLQVADHDPITLSRKETQWYLKSFRFLENMGLGYLVRTIKPETLSSIIALSGKNGHRVDNKDGDFTEDERFYFLKTLGKVLGIEGMNETINFAQSKELLEKTFYQAGSTTEWGFEKIATKIGLIRNGGFKIDEFTQRIKQA